MAYNFISTSSQYLSIPYSLSATMPMTLACFSKAAISGTLTQISFGILNGSHRNQLVRLPANTLRLTAVGSNGTITADTTATVANNEWHHVAGTFETSSRTPYLNGVAGNTNTTNIGTQLPFNLLLIGARYGPGLGLYFNGDIADLGVWNVILTNSEIVSLAQGATCNKVRPQNLIFYAPLIRNLQDTKNGRIITPNNGPALATHPRVYI